MFQLILGFTLGFHPLNHGISGEKSQGRGEGGGFGGFQKTLFFLAEIDGFPYHLEYKVSGQTLTCVPT